MEPQQSQNSVPVPTQNPTQDPKKENYLLEIVKFTLIAFLLVFFVIRPYIGEPFIVDGASMDPTFATGQYLIVDKLSYDFKKPQREDVIILRYPNNPSTFYIKRIIGLPGETLTMKNGVITASSTTNPQGMVIPDPHVSESRRTYDNFTITLGPTEYFVMGDNRAQSSDSRAWGPLEAKYIVGRPLVRLLPFSQMSAFPGE